ncbi:MAG: hypothetical protein NT069_02095 [Planctomycetota bacterium]|nr:hypothetical protein [Planctomycetota bacterium]
MSHFKQVGLLALFGFAILASISTPAHAGILDRLLGRESKPEVARAQSHSDGDADSDCFCQDCDHTPCAGWAQLCRKKCGATYYPSKPPYCAPCWGVYPTCWRRGQECWVCPQEKWSSKPSKSAQGNRVYVPPSPSTYGSATGGSLSAPSAPKADPEVDVNESTATPDLETPPAEVIPPQSRRANPPSVRQASSQASTSRSAVAQSSAARSAQTVNRPVPPPVRREPVAAKAAHATPSPAVKPAKNKSIEELLRDLE